ncbi:MAG: AbrB/MazE/SpoVT family DNA-binding domain-containing protein [Gemmatimonadetes bacterium]|nr:AbrB/MazE/SpoVT family DNA-binding domain-containing protein [Gemmatimonadota bacterium]
MPVTEKGRMGKRGTLVIPAKLRQIYGLEEGVEVLAQETAEGILIRPAVTLPIELHGPERKAEILLANAVDETDYQAAVVEVRKLGLDPSRVAYRRPDHR